jgi:hypothetical protein
MARNDVNCEKTSTQECGEHLDLRAFQAEFVDLGEKRDALVVAEFVVEFALLRLELAE